MNGPEVPLTPLEQLHIAAKLTEEGDPICLLQASGGDAMLIGQMDTAAVRHMALTWLATAEEADADAYVYRVLQSHANLATSVAQKIMDDLEAEKRVKAEGIADQARILAEQDDDLG